MLMSKSLTKKKSRSSLRWKLSCRVGEITLCARRNSIVYPPRESNRDRLCGIIDTILAEQPKDFEVFLQKLIQQGLRGEAWQAHGGEGQGAEDQQCRRTAGTSNGGDRTLSCHGRFHQGGGNEVGRNRRAALRKLVSSVYLESDLNLPFGKNGKFLFQLGYTPVVSDMNKIVQKAAALSFPKWALAVWDMDTATLYMVKYDRSH